MIQSLWFILAQAMPRGTIGGSGPDLALILAVCLLVGGAGTLWWIAAQRRKHTTNLQDLTVRYRLQKVTDPEETARLEEAVADIFGAGPKVSDRLRLNARGLTAYVERMRIPLYRVDHDGGWDDRYQESQERLVVLVTGFDEHLPAFRLMPNSWPLRTLRGKEGNLFHNVMPFGHRNYVVGRDRARVAHLLGGDLQQMLRQNRRLSIDARPDFLVFYLQDRAQPRNLSTFLDEALDIATAIRNRAAKPAVAA